MNLHIGLWVKVKIKDCAYYGIITEVNETSVDLVIQSSDDNHLSRFTIPVEDIIEIGC